MNIRKATPEDALNIASIAFTVWIDTYATDGTRGDLSRYVFEHFTPEKFTDLIRQQPFLVAENKGHLLGYSKLAPDKELWELETIYILPRFRSQGVGEKLIEASLSESQRGLWLACWEKNSKAIKFYEKLGFNETGENWFDLEGKMYRNVILSLKIV